MAFVLRAVLAKSLIIGGIIGMIQPVNAVPTFSTSADTPSKPLDCKFTLHNLQFNICSLFDATPKSVWKSVKTPPTRTSLEYHLNLRGPLTRNASRSAESQCPDGTWVCLRKWNGLEGDQSSRRLTQVVPVASSRFLAPDSPPQHPPEPSILETHDHLNMTVTLGEQKWWREEHPILVISMGGGMYVTQKQRLILGIVCDEHVDEISSPTIESELQSFGWHYLKWRTKHACPLNGWENHRHPDPDSALPTGDGERLRGSDKAKHSVMFWSFLIFVAALVIHTFVRVGGKAYLPAILSMFTSAILNLRTMVAVCLTRPGSSKRPEHAQLLWSADEVDDGGFVVGSRDDVIPGFAIDETNVDHSPLSSPTKSRSAAQYPPTYGVATPRTALLAGSSGGKNTGLGNVLGRLADFVKSRFHM